MENSSKALLIAAAVLIVILLIAVSIKIFNSPQDVQQQATDVGMSISREVEDATEDLSSSFEINREFISGEVSGNPSDETQGSDSTTNWHIKNVDELKQFANLVNSGNNFEGITVYLDEDLDLNNENWTPIGNNETPFLGTFDGQNHYIRRINVNIDTSYAGLFGYAKEIKNLTVKDSTIKSKKSYVGGIAGAVSNVDNSISQGNKVSGRSYVGGISGITFTNSEIVNCRNTSQVEAILTEEETTEHIKTYGSHTGGISGFISMGTVIKNCVNEGKITSNRSRIGGIVGDTSTKGIKIINCINKGNITLQTYNGTEQYVAGIVGLIATDSQDPSSNSNESNRNIVSCCYNEGEVKGRASVGGISGCIAQYLSLIEKCYNTGKISGDISISGIDGTMGRSSQIINCYNAGNIYGNTNVAGILASSYNSANSNGGIINCYNIGKINDVENSNIITGSNSKYEAEIVGRNGNNIILINCIANRDKIKTDFINNAENNAWEIKSGINNGYPVIVGMN